MRKATIIIALLLMSITFFASGCINIDINTGIDADFTSYLSYRIDMDVSEFDQRYQSLLKNALNRIGWHYQEELGFVVQMDIESDQCFLVMTRRVTNDSFEQAFESLESMLTNEDMTLFMQVDMAFQNFERQNRYLLYAETDIPQIMRLSNAEELPPSLLPRLEEAMEAGEGMITLTLPASEIVSSSHQANIVHNQAVMTVPLDFTAQTNLELAGIVNLLGDGTAAGSFDEIIREQTRQRNNVIFICSAAILVLLMTMLIINILKKRG